MAFNAKTVLEIYLGELLFIDVTEIRYHNLRDQAA
jgi:hypothetical protein